MPRLLVWELQPLHQPLHAALPLRQRPDWHWCLEGRGKPAQDRPPPPTTPNPVASAPTCVTLKRVQGQLAVLLSTTQCTVTMPAMTGCISVGQNACGWDQIRAQLPQVSADPWSQIVAHTPPALAQLPHPCSVSALLTFSWVSGGLAETSTWAPCSHTSSQSSSGLAGPVSTTWSRPKGPPCRAQLVGSQGLRYLLPTPQLQEPPNQQPQPEKYKWAQGHPHRLTGKSQASGTASAELSALMAEQ